MPRVVDRAYAQMLCQNFLGLCPLPPTAPLNLTNWFARPKPSPLPPPKKPSGERVKVLHISDAHIDPRMLFVFQMSRVIGP